MLNELKNKEVDVSQENKLIELGKMKRELEAK